MSSFLDPAILFFVFGLVVLHVVAYGILSEQRQLLGVRFV